MIAVIYCSSVFPVLLKMAMLMRYARTIPERYKDKVKYPLIRLYIISWPRVHWLKRRRCFYENFIELIRL